jgi:hypothetical protein
MSSEVIPKLVKSKENKFKNKKKFGAESNLDTDSLKYLYSVHQYTYKNSEFGEALKTCFINNNVHLKKSVNKKFLVEEIDGRVGVLVTSLPKWKTFYDSIFADEITGEIVRINKETDSLKSQRVRLQKCLSAFDQLYKIPYRRREVTCMFITLSRVTHAKHSIRTFLKQYKKALSRNGINLLGYVWCCETSFENGWGHIHYHLVIAVSRLHVKGGSLPDVLTQKYIGTPDGSGLWGQKSSMVFVYSNKIKNGVMRSQESTALNIYLNEYISKETGVVLGIRRYGSSRNISKLTAKKKNIMNDRDKAYFLLL